MSSGVVLEKREPLFYHAQMTIISFYQMTVVVGFHGSYGIRMLSCQGIVFQQQPQAQAQ
jgi:hypothetical protein